MDFYELEDKIMTFIDKSILIVKPYSAWRSYCETLLSNYLWVSLSINVLTVQATDFVHRHFAQSVERTVVITLSIYLSLFLFSYFVSFGIFYVICPMISIGKQCYCMILSEVLELLMS